MKNEETAARRTLVFIKVLESISATTCETRHLGQMPLWASPGNAVRPTGHWAGRWQFSQRENYRRQKLNGTRSHRRNHRHRAASSPGRFHPHPPPRRWKISCPVCWSRNGDTSFPASWRSGRGLRCRVRTVRNEIRRSAWRNNISWREKFKRRVCLAVSKFAERGSVSRRPSLGPSRRCGSQTRAPKPNEDTAVFLGHL